MSKQPNILIVDDPKGITDVYSDFLADPKFVSRFAYTTEDALRLIATDPPDMVIADVTKLKNVDKLIELVQKFEIRLIWASKFSGLDFEKLPLMTRLINKPFRTIDLKYAVRAEFAKHGRQIML